MADSGDQLATFPLDPALSQPTTPDTAPSPRPRRPPAGLDTSRDLAYRNHACGHQHPATGRQLDGDHSRSQDQPRRGVGTGPPRSHPELSTVAPWVSKWLAPIARTDPRASAPRSAPGPTRFPTMSRPGSSGDRGAVESGQLAGAYHARNSRHGTFTETVPGRGAGARSFQRHGYRYDLSTEPTGSRSWPRRSPRAALAGGRRQRLRPLSGRVIRSGWTGLGEVGATASKIPAPSPRRGGEVQPGPGGVSPLRLTCATPTARPWCTMGTVIIS